MPQHGFHVKTRSPSRATNVTLAQFRGSRCKKLFRFNSRMNNWINPGPKALSLWMIYPPLPLRTEIPSSSSSNGHSNYLHEQPVLGRFKNLSTSWQGSSQVRLAWWLSIGKITWSRGPRSTKFSHFLVKTNNPKIKQVTPQRSWVPNFCSVASKTDAIRSNKHLQSINKPVWAVTHDY